MTDKGKRKRWRVRKWIAYLLLILVTLFVAAEIILRSYLGFCDAVLIRDDPNYEYIAAANQHRFRFRSHISYNRESMRSNDIDNTAVKLLAFGDSLLNGGTLTDQDSLATTILTNALSKELGKAIQVLNVSAGSWGPDNCYAFLEKNGDYGAKHIILFVSSHDAYDNMTFEKIVGVNPSFPNQQYKLAIVELIDRYLVPRLFGEKKSTGSQTDNLGISKKGKNSKFNSGFESFLAYSRLHDLTFTIYLHADTKELRAGNYNDQGMEIIQFAEENNVRLIKDLQNGLMLSDFRDDIHLNEQGQRRMAEVLEQYILDKLDL